MNCYKYCPLLIILILWSCNCEDFSYPVCTKSGSVSLVQVNEEISTYEITNRDIVAVSDESLLINYSFENIIIDLSFDLKVLDLVFNNSESGIEINNTPLEIMEESVNYNFQAFLTNRSCELNSNYFTDKYPEEKNLVVPNSMDGVIWFSAISADQIVVQFKLNFDIMSSIRYQTGTDC